jgi:hypothetical protein
MRTLLFCVIGLAGCATSPVDLAKMSPAELCYTAMVDEDNKAKAEAEILRRKEDCQKHQAEIKKIHEYEQRAGQTGGGVGEGTPRPSGGMTRTY